MVVFGDNTYGGDTAINEGSFRITHPNALGSNAAGTTLQAGTNLQLQTGLDVSEPITTAGSGDANIQLGLFVASASYSGTLTLGAMNTNISFVPASLSGRLTGSGNVAFNGGDDVLTLSGTTSDYTGATTISTGASGAVRLLAAGVLPDATAVMFSNANSRLDLNDFAETIGSLSGPGQVTTGAGAGDTLTVGGDNTSTTFDGVISQNGGLTKIGSGTFTLSGANTYSGTTTVSAGRLNVNGSIAGSTTVDGGALGGTGTVDGTVTVPSGGTVSPGASPGILNTGNLQFGAPMTSLQFDGVNDRVSANVDGTGLTTFSIELRLFPTGTIGTDKGLFGWSAGPGDNTPMILWRENAASSTLTFYLNGDNRMAVPLPRNTQSHIARTPLRGFIMGLTWVRLRLHP